jgi:phage tail protein X
MLKDTIRRLAWHIYRRLSPQPGLVEFTPALPRYVEMQFHDMPDEGSRNDLNIHLDRIAVTLSL